MNPSNIAPSWKRYAFVCSLYVQFGIRYFNVDESSFTCGTWVKQPKRVWLSFLC